MHLCQAAYEGLALCVGSYLFLMFWDIFTGASVIFWEAAEKSCRLRKGSHMFVMSGRHGMSWSSKSSGVSRF